MNEFLRELATLGLVAGALVLLGTCSFLIYRNVRMKLARKRDARKRQVVLALLAAACIAIAVWLAPVIDAPRRPLFDYVGILLAVACLSALGAVALDLLAGLQLRLRGAIPLDAWIRAGDFTGQISQRGLLQVVITTAEGDSVHLPNRYLLQVPIRRVASGGNLTEVNRPAYSGSADQPAVTPVAATDLSVGAHLWRSSAPLVTAERREPVLDSPLADPDESDAPVVGNKPEPAVQEAPKPVLDPHTAAELVTLKSEYTELSQQLLEVERSLQAAGQGEERQPLSLQKKKMEARLFRLGKQISQLEAGERRRA